MAVDGCAFTQLAIEFEGFLFGDEHRRIAKPQFGRELDGFRASGPNDVAGRMRFLVRRRPWVEEAIRIEVAVVTGRPWLGPGLQNDVDRFLVTLTRRHRIDRICPIFHAGAERKRYLKAAFR